MTATTGRTGPGEPSAGDAPRIWPLFGLSLSTERLRLAPVRDADLDLLSGLAQTGIHDVDRSPFSNPWADRTGADFTRGFAQYFWAQRARWSPASWTLPFAVRSDDGFIGVQQLQADDFVTLRSVGTGSWIARVFQGRGFGTEMRAAVLAFAFEHLGAEEAISGAYDYNRASIRVSQKLGYAPNGTRYDNVRGKAERACLFRIDREAWLVRSSATVDVTGFEVCRGLFGLV